MSSNAAILWLALFAADGLLAQGPAKKGPPPRPPDSVVFETFFLRVADEKDSSGILTPGGPLALSDYERRALRTLAIDFQSKLRALSEAVHFAEHGGAVSNDRVESVFVESEGRGRGDSGAAVQTERGIFPGFEVDFSPERLRLVQDFVRNWNPAREN